MNDNGSNFSLIRNKEINRIGPKYITPQFKAQYKLDQHIKDKNAWHDPAYEIKPVQIWLHDDTFRPNYTNELFNPDYDKQFGIITIKALLNNIDRIKLLEKTHRNDMLLLDNSETPENIFALLADHNLTRIKFYILKDTPIPNLINYFERIYKSVAASELIM
jgi:hypothetical protein